MSENVKTDACQSFREKIYTMIFPRWALIILIAIGAGSIGTMYMLNRQASKEADNAMGRTKIIDVEIEHLKDGQRQIQSQLSRQQTLLIAIDKKVVGSNRH